MILKFQLFYLANKSQKMSAVLYPLIIKALFKILEHCDVTFDLLDSVAEELLLSLISFILLPDIKESNADFTSFLRF